MLAGLAPGAPGWGADPDALEIHDGTGTVTRTPATPGDQMRFYRAVAETIMSGSIDDTAALEAVQVMACLEAAFTSARTGTSADVPRLPDGLEP